MELKEVDALANVNVNTQRKPKSKVKAKAKVKVTKRGMLLLAIIIVIILGISYKCIKSITRDNNRTINNAMVTGDMIGISPRTIGEVIRIDVQAGMHVKKGDILYLLDGKEFVNELKHAEAMLEIAKTELDKAVGGACIQEIVAAQTLVLQANADYDSKIASRDSIRNSYDTLDRTYAMLLKQMKNYINPKNRNYDSDYAMKLLNNAYSKKIISDTQFTMQAQIIREQFQFKSQLEEQLADMRGQVKSCNANIEASKAAIQNAESKLKLVSDGVSNKDMAILVSKVKAAQIAYDQAKMALDQTKVRAPQDGTVMQILDHNGEIAVPGKPVLYLADLEKLYICALVDGKALNKVKIGQTVKVKLETCEDTGKGTGTDNNSGNDNNSSVNSNNSKNKDATKATATSATASETTTSTSTSTTFNGTIKEIGVSTLEILKPNSKDKNKTNEHKNTVPIKITIDNNDKKLIMGMDVEIDTE
jgi:membrane fusion protein, multidrug efflux system